MKQKELTKIISSWKKPIGLDGLYKCKVFQRCKGSEWYGPTVCGFCGPAHRPSHTCWAQREGANPPPFSVFVISRIGFRFQTETVADLKEAAPSSTPLASFWRLRTGGDPSASFSFLHCLVLGIETRLRVRRSLRVWGSRHRSPLRVWGLVNNPSADGEDSLLSLTLILIILCIG